MLRYSEKYGKEGRMCRSVMDDSEKREFNHAIYVDTTLNLVSFV